MKLEKCVAHPSEDDLPVQEKDVPESVFDATENKVDKSVPSLNAFKSGKLPQREGKGNSVEETLKEPLERVESRVNVEFLNRQKKVSKTADTLKSSVAYLKVLPHFGQKLLNDLVVVLSKAKQLWKARNEEAVHCVPLIRHQRRDGPKSVLQAKRVNPFPFMNGNANITSSSMYMSSRAAIWDMP